MQSQMDRNERLVTYVTLAILAIGFLFLASVVFGQPFITLNENTPRHSGTGLYYMGQLTTGDTHVWMRPTSIYKIVLTDRSKLHGDGSVPYWNVQVFAGGTIQTILFKDKTEDEVIEALERSMTMLHSMELERQKEEKK